MSQEYTIRQNRPNNISRRNFLNAACVAASAAACISIFPTRAFSSLPNGITVMGEVEYGVFSRLTHVMLPVEGTTLVPPSQIPVLPTLDGALLATMEPSILKGLKGGIKYFNDGPQEKFGKKFVDLTDEEAIHFCDSWANSSEHSQRALAMGLKKLVGLAYWANPPTWQPLGYDGPVSKRWGLEPYGNAPMPKH